MANPQNARNDESLIMKDAFGESLLVPQTGFFEMPQVGDIFVVTTEGLDRGLVMISATSADPFVLAWVVTTDVAGASFPAFRIMIPDMGAIAVWPESEFGLSTAALGRKIANFVDSRTIHTLRMAPEHAELKSVIDFYQDDNSEKAFENLAKVVDAAWLLGDWRWPTDELGSLVLAPGFVEKTKIEPKVLAELLHATPKRIAGLLNGSIIPTSSELVQLTDLLPAESSDIQDYLSPITESEESHQSYPIYNALASPSYKDSVHHIMRKQNINEVDSRNIIWQESFALAARQSEPDPEKRTHDRIKQAISGILEEE